jgi:DNA repair protein RecN (Recombination protein N)
MLRELHILNYAVVDSLQLEFFPGLNLFTGETGSGKSILVDALGLALGGRASPDVIRTGQSRASIAAVFQSTGGIKRWFDEYGLMGPDDDVILLRREIQADGRSRLLVNDQPVTLSAVRGLSRRLVDVHGQNEQVALLDRAVQLDLLDQYAGARECLDEVRGLFWKVSELRREMDELGRGEKERLRSLDLFRFQAQELDHAALQTGEDSQLEEEKRVLSNIERLRSAAVSAFDALYEEEGSACALLAHVEKDLDELSRYDASTISYLEPLSSARATLEDLASSLRDYLARLEPDPARLEAVEERLAMLDKLKRKYGASIEEMMAYRDRAIQQIAQLEHADERCASLSQEIEKRASEYRRVAAVLSEKRRTAARTFERQVREELRQLGMEKARFEIEFILRSDEIGSASGVDEIEMRLSANPGEASRPLERVASGGELSRLMLALKTVVAASPDAGDGTPGTSSSKGEPRRQDSVAGGDPPTGLNAKPGGDCPRTEVGHSTGTLPATFVFDEVDSGIGGRVAECVGLRLKRLARSAQVLCVTHQAQIAGFADHHFCVEKRERNGRTVTEVRYLRGEKERAQELARMLSGSHITEAVLKHAAAMLKNSASREE